LATRLVLKREDLLELRRHLVLEDLTVARYLLAVVETMGRKGADGGDELIAAKWAPEELDLCATVWGDGGDAWRRWSVRAKKTCACACGRVVGTFVGHEEQIVGAGGYAGDILARGGGWVHGPKEGGEGRGVMGHDGR
jgi:hypothetical protein